MLEFVRKYCLSKPCTSEDFPFDETTLCFRVCGKIFAITDIDNPEFMNLKADPEKAIEWRETYEGVKPGYHMNKKMWNSIYLDRSVPVKVLQEMIDHSYDEVVKKLPLKQRKKILSSRK